MTPDLAADVGSNCSYIGAGDRAQYNHFKHGESHPAKGSDGRGSGPRDALKGRWHDSRHSFITDLAENVGGRSGWTTTPNGETKALQQEGSEVTGTAGPAAEKQWSLRKGKLDGQKLSFEVPTEDGGLLVFDLTFDGMTIQGTCAGTGSGGEKMTAKLNLKRAT